MTTLEVSLLETENLLNNYTKWLRRQYQVTHLQNSDSDEISTPFLNNIGDNIRLYVSNLADNSFQLDDDGETLNNLSLLGINVDSALRKRMIHNTCEEFSITLSEDILQVAGTVADFPAMKQHLISAILKIDDLSLLKKTNVQKLFAEELYNFLDKNDFGGLPQYAVKGQTGNSYKIDYVIPQNHAQSKPMRLVDFQDHVSFNQVAIAAYKFQDITNTLPVNASFSIIFNDTQHTLPVQALNAANKSGISLLRWNQQSSLEKLR